MSTLASSIIAKIQADIGTDANGNPLKSDGIAGAMTDGAYAAVKSAASAGLDWPPVAQSPVPAPASPSAPIVSTGGASPFVFADSVEPWSSDYASRFKQLSRFDARLVGRYFAKGGATYQYQPSKENAAIIASGAPVLMIAENTRDVAGSLGSEEGAGVAQNIFDCFGVDAMAAKGSEYVCFLDCEGDPDLSVAYWTAWSHALISTSASLSGGRVKLLPSIYASKGDNGTWVALKKAVIAGAPLSAIWVAAYEFTNANNIPLPAPAWDTREAQTEGASFTAPVVAWQYAGVTGPKAYMALDGNMVAPGQEAWLTSRCFLPTSGSV